MSLTPRTAFENFPAHLAFFTAPSDAAVEGQHFERKEIPRPSSGNVPQSTMKEIKEQIRETVSAFANSNADGGLMVIGIAKTGDLRGLAHLTDAQRNDLSNIK